MPEFQTKSAWGSAREAATTSARASARPPSLPRRAGRASFSARKSRREEEEVARSSPIRRVSSLNAPTSSATSRPPPCTGAEVDGDGAAAAAAEAPRRKACGRGGRGGSRRGRRRPRSPWLGSVGWALLPPATDLAVEVAGGWLGPRHVFCQTHCPTQTCGY